MFSKDFIESIKKIDSEENRPKLSDSSLLNIKPKKIENTEQKSPSFEKYLSHLDRMKKSDEKS